MNKQAKKLLEGEYKSQWQKQADGSTMAVVQPGEMKAMKKHQTNIERFLDENKVSHLQVCDASEDCPFSLQTRKKREGNPEAVHYLSSSC